MDKVRGQINFNTVVQLIVLAVILWVGASIQQHTSKLSEISQDVAVLKSTVDAQGKELTDLKSEQQSQTIALAQIGWDVGGRMPLRHPPAATAPPKQNNP